MYTRTVLSLLLAVGMVAATGGVTIAQVDSQATATDSSNVQTDASQQEQATNYTRLYIEDRHKHLELKPGESDTITITVENGEDDVVDLSPQVVVPPRGQPPIEESWLTIEPGNTTLAAGETREFNVTVSVPDDAEIRRYGGEIALTDERVQTPGRPGPARPIHGVSLGVEVWQEPTVRVDADRYMFSQVKAGDSFSTEITVENTGEQAVPLNPQLNTDDRRRHGAVGNQERLDRSWMTIDAPSEVGAGETETIEITVSPPADAERGNYNAELDLGINDPTRNEQRSHWQEVRLRFQVWSQPDEAFETSFDVSQATTDTTLELTADQHPRASDERTDADFNVTFVAPDGTEVEAERVQVTDNGHVSLGDERQSGRSNNTYAARGESQRVTYRLEEPGAGTWSVRIMPENTMNFEYEIVRNED